MTERTAPSGTTRESYARAVAGWAEHLRGGGTTTWAAWREDVPGPLAAPRQVLPSATHLELVRRINERAGAPVPGLADLVLATGAPGRGRVDVPLPWPEPHRFGTPPIEPEPLPDEELVRLAVGVLPAMLIAVDRPSAPRELARWPVPWRRRFRLYGSPGTVAGVRSALLGQGLVESDWRPVHIVLARPMETMMAEQWAAAALRGSQLRWATLWRRAVALDALPASLDVVGTAERLVTTARQPRESVHLVVAHDAEQMARDVARLLRARPFELAAAAGVGQTDLLRRVNRQTVLTHGPGLVRRLAASLAGVLADSPARTTALAVPEAALPWARRAAAVAAERAARAGYAVHGEPEVMAPSESGLPGAVEPRHTLEVAVEACLLTWRRLGNPERGLG